MPRRRTSGLRPDWRSLLRLWRFETEWKLSREPGPGARNWAQCPVAVFVKRIENKEQLRPSAWLKFHTLINVCTERRKYLTANDKLSRFKPLWSHIFIGLILIRILKVCSCRIFINIYLYGFCPFYVLRNKWWYIYEDMQYASHWILCSLHTKLIWMWFNNDS